MKTSLLIIDPQNDFCIPGAPLYVKGADVDMNRLSKFITENATKIDSICVSLDMHVPEDIAHPIFWINNEGQHPAPFTTITVENMENGTWKTTNPIMQNHALYYLKKLKENERFPHTIWPEHCIAGSSGVNIFPTLYAALRKWMEVTGKTFTTYIKGMNPTTEHFGIFQSEVPGGDEGNLSGSKGEFNHNLFKIIFGQNENVLVGGQAKSHCVATSLRQVLETHPDYVKKITLLTDTTSDVEGLGYLGFPIYVALKEAGMKESTTEEIFKQETV